MIEVDVSLAQGDFTLDAAFAGSSGITALFGPSGAGKTTLIDLIAGIRRPDRGSIRVGGRTLVDTAAGIFVAPHRRRIGLVFQDARLFPHLTVRRNLLYGRAFAPRPERRIALEPVVEALGIGHLMDRRPAGLSGGERQRVAFGRALLASPRLLLMDEPLAALDTARKAEILPLIERMRDEFGIPIVYVSHAVEEIARLADHVVALDGGRVAAAGPPNAVLHAPPAGGDGRFRIASVLEGELGPVDEDWLLTPVAHPAGTVWLTGRVGPPGRRVRVVIRGTDVALASRVPEDITIRTRLSGVVAAVAAGDGPLATVEVALPGGGTLAAIVTRKALHDLSIAVGTTVTALVKTVALDERPLAG